MTRPPIRLRIDHLVLTGIDPKDRAAVRRAFEAELGRLLQASPVPEQGSRSPGLALSLPQPNSPRAAGMAAAGAVVRALGGGR
jgi:hypothetical protein